MAAAPLLHYVAIASVPVLKICLLGAVGAVLARTVRGGEGLYLPCSDHKCWCVSCADHEVVHATGHPG